MSAKQVIIEEMNAVATMQNVSLAEFDDSLPMLESGLDSLGFAILVVRLEDRLGVDPFSAAETTAFPTTLGELVGIYDAFIPKNKLLVAGQ